MIAGLQKMTLLDYPGKVACTVFLQHCNFRCPFCHNSELLPGQGEVWMDLPEFLAFLGKRKGLLDAVCVSGGEPTLSPELEAMLTGIKELGFAVKLDTNGSRPELLKKLVDRQLVDYVAMDIKNSPRRYGQTIGLPQYDLAAVEASMAFLLSGAVDYEFRTTVVQQLHDAASIEEMGRWAADLVPGRKAGKWFLQRFVDRDSVLFSGLSAPEEEQMTHYAELLAPFVQLVGLR